MLKTKKMTLFSLILVVMFCMTITAVGASDFAQTATPTSSTVIVDGTVVEFEAYLINGYNFFRLRDLAYVLNGSSKQFSVGWNGVENAISLTSGQPYEAIGGEMARGNGIVKTANPTTSRVFLDGQELNLTAYNIGGNNFFRLRDIMEALEVIVIWDGLTNTIGIYTSLDLYEPPEGASILLVPADEMNQSEVTPFRARGQVRALRDVEVRNVYNVPVIINAGEILPYNISAGIGYLLFRNGEVYFATSLDGFEIAP